MDTVIIGIHGLRNKPPKDLLADWWKKSIVEGFQAFQLPVLEFDFEMAYWAHYLNSKPQDGSITDTKDPQFLEEPYEPGTNFGPRDPNPFKKNISIGIHKQIFQLIAGKSAFMNIEAVSNIILHRMFVELDIYYHHDIPDEQGRSRPAKEILREELAGYLSRHAGKKILILAHSMGSIIAYDVLMHTVPDIPVQTLITFGAPLGFPVITTKIKHELNLDPKSDDLLPTPPSLKGKWLNFSDLDDVTCMNYNLRNHYTANKNGVRPFDQIVYNNYEHQGCDNPHKAYGYLRTHEITRAVYSFLALENARLGQRIKWIFSPPEF